MRWILGLALLCALAPQPSPAEEIVANEAVVEGSADSVWKLLTTQRGLESWVVPHANVDLRTGGFLKTNHMANGKIGDENTVTSQILDVKSKKKLSIKLVEAPKSIPMAASMVGTWYEITLI
ncbi:MAG: SRPBCC domain-containing protein, partial [Candidatus Eiseniibacteriota bacterium]